MVEYFNTAAPPPSDCMDDEISCDGQCFPQYIRCNGYPDCSSGIDEENCQTQTEPAIITTQAPTTDSNIICPEYKCPNENVCFGQADRCDGRWKCQDGYDDYGCPRKSFEVNL